MQTRINILQKENWEEEIKLLYQDDVVHTILHHIKSGEGVNECVKHTLDVLNESPHTTVAKLIGEDGRKLGLFSNEKINDIIVVAFWFIDVESRTPKRVQEYWSKIREVLGETFYTSINTKNDKAISHLLRNGFTQIQELPNNQLIFKS